MAQFTGATDKSLLIEPKVFSDYVIEQQTETNRLYKSGILVMDPFIQAQLTQGGTYVDIPELAALEGDAQPWNDTDDISVQSTSSFHAVAPKIYQAKAFGYKDFAKLTTGAPLADQIGNQFAGFWDIECNKLIIAVLKNAFLNADLATAKSYGLDTPAELSPADFLAAKSRMGDVDQPQLVKIIVNSAVISAMEEQNLISFIQPSQAAAPIAYYNQLEIVADDAIPVAVDGTTDAYLVANGALAHGLTGAPDNAYEVQRDALGQGGQTAIINRRIVAIQLKNTTFSDPTKVPGLSTAVISGATTSLYAPVGNPRNIGVVDYRFKIDPKFIVKGINSPKA